MSKSANHTKAPKAAAFVAGMRSEFGDVKVTHVREGSVLLGEPMEKGGERGELTIPYLGKDEKVVGYTLVGYWRANGD